jgi:hypothetical protein
MTNTKEDTYLVSVKQLKVSLTKFITFIGIGYLIWVIITTFFIPLAKGILIGKVEALKLESLLTLAVVFTLVALSFNEMKNIADSSANLLAFYMGASSPTEVRVEKLRASLRVLFLLIPFILSYYLMFRSLIEQINPTINILLPIGIMIWTIVALIIFTMVLGLEIEEAAKVFLKKIRKRKGLS